MEFTTNMIGSTIFQSLMVAGEEHPDEFVIKMLTNNEIDGLLPLSTIRKNLDMEIRYNVTSLIPLAQMMQEPLSRQKVLNIIKSIVTGAQRAEEYMLSANGLVMDENYIYVNVADGEAHLMYLPIANPFKVDIVSFVKRLITCFQYLPGEDSSYILKLMNAFNSGNISTVDELGDFILQLEKEGNAKNAAPVPDKHVATPIQRAEKPLPVKMPEVTPHIEEEKNHVQPVMPSVPAGQIKDTKNENNAGKNKLPFHFGKTAKEKPEEKKTEKSKKGIFGSKPASTDSAAPATPIRIPGSASETPGFAIPGQQPDYSAPIEKPQQPSSSSINSDISGKPLTPQEEMQAIKKTSVTSSQTSTDLFRGNLPDYGNTVMINQNNSNVTRMLDESDMSENGQMRASVTRLSNRQKMYMDKNILKIGKESDYVDFYIGNNQTISRYHADIICENGMYYIRDNNSKNHTYLNGQQIIPGQMIPIENNTKFRLSNEEFIFQLS